MSRIQNDVGVIHEFLSDAVAGIFGPHIGLNEDGKGTYGICCAGTKGPYTMIFDDLAFWSRALTEEEVKSLAMSGKSVSELFP